MRPRRPAPPARPTRAEVGLNVLDVLIGGDGKRLQLAGIGQVDSQVDSTSTAAVRATHTSWSGPLHV